MKMEIRWQQSHQTCDDNLHINKMLCTWKCSNLVADEMLLIADSQVDENVFSVLKVRPNEIE